MPIRARIARFLACAAIVALTAIVVPIVGPWPSASAQAAEINAEFRTALSPYGHWQHHAQWGEVWIVENVPADWRPYTRGRWIYTEEWGWYWDAAFEEADWGWVTYHYGRWAYDHEFGWVWVPGDDWAPAWVDWRYGDDYVGWAPLPPEDLLVVYRDDPLYWCFVQPRYLLAPRIAIFIAPPRERIVIIKRTKIVNRTVIVDRGRDGDRRRGRVGVNAGIDPAIIAKATGRPIRAAKVEPAVLRGTNIQGGREIDPGQGRRARASIRESDTFIRPAARIQPPKEFGANEKGGPGEKSPMANRAASVREIGIDRRPRDEGSVAAASRFARQSPSLQPPVNIIRGGVAESSRFEASPFPRVHEQRAREHTALQMRPPPALPPSFRPTQPPPPSFRSVAPPRPAFRQAPPSPPAMSRAMAAYPPVMRAERGPQPQLRTGNRQNNPRNAQEQQMRQR